MSGIEIAGLVLGAIPVLLHALEKYREGAEVLGDWWRFKRAYKKCKQDLDYHRLIFEENVQGYLLPLVVDDDELKSLMADPAGDGWRSDELEMRLKERLPQSYNVFLGIMKEVNELMDLLKKQMGIRYPNFLTGVDQRGNAKGKTAKKDILSLENFDFHAKKLQFSLKKPSRDRVFSRLKEANDQLRKLLESNNNITSARRQHRSNRLPSIINKKLQDYWRHATRLHNALTRASNTGQCGCTKHFANLQIEAQQKSSDRVEFDILFDLEATRTQRHHQWRETKIEMVSNVTPAINMRSQGTNPMQPSRRVQVIGPNDARPMQSTQAQVKIRDLCLSLSMPYPTCFGFMDEDGHRFIVYPGARSSAISSFPTLPLTDILDGKRDLTRRGRYRVALTIAHWFLRLGSTPWLDSRLKDNILFIEDENQNGTLKSEQLYIRHDLSNMLFWPAADAIHGLGICLLELCFGTPLETNKFRKQLPIGSDNQKPMLDYAAALKWSSEVGEEAGPEFAEAIDWCLRVNISDESWRREIWGRVIVPLDACHRQVSQKLNF